MDSYEELSSIGVASGFPDAASQPGPGPGPSHNDDGAWLVSLIALSSS